MAAAGGLRRARIARIRSRARLAAGSSVAAHRPQARHRCNRTIPDFWKTKSRRSRALLRPRRPNQEAMNVSGGSPNRRNTLRNIRLNERRNILRKPEGKNA